MGLFDAFTSKIPTPKEVVKAPMVNPWPAGSTQATAWEGKTEKEQRWLGGADPTDPYIAARMKSDLASTVKKAVAVPAALAAQAVSKDAGVANIANDVKAAAGVKADAKGVVSPSISEDTGVNGYAVRLIAVRNFPAESVIFRVTPTFSESRAVEYAQVAPVHLPGSIQVYRRTGSRTFSIGAKFVSRNRAQATENMKFLQLLRGWTMPYFGERDYMSAGAAATEQATPNGMTVLSEDANSMLGAPPDVLYLYAYSSTVGDANDRATGQGLVNLKKIPVVITNLNVTYPDDVDYIPVEGTNEPFPVKMEVTVELIETHAPTGYEKFSLSMFKKGELVQF